MFISRKLYNKLVYIYLILLYIQFSNCFFLGGFKVFDSLVIVNLAILYISLVIRVCLRKKSDNEVKFLVLLFTVFFMYVMGLSLQGKIVLNQSAFNTLGQIKYIFFFLSIIPFCDKNLKINTLVRTFFCLEFITSVIYNFHFIFQIPYKYVSYYYQPIGNIILIRNYAVPILYYFLVTFLLNEIIKDNTRIFKKRISIIMLLSFCMTLICNLSRTTWILLIMQIIITYLYITKMHVWKFKNIIILLCLVASTAVLINQFPIISQRIESIQIELDSGEGTFEGRINTINERYEYLLKSNQLLFGVGPFSDKTIYGPIPLFSDGRKIYNADSGLAQALLQFGMCGIIIFILLILYSVNILIRKRCAIMISYILFIIAIMIESIISNYIITTAFLSIPIAFSICYKYCQNN